MYVSPLDFLFYSFFFSLTLRFFIKNWNHPGRLYDEASTIFFAITITWGTFRYLEMFPPLETSIFRAAVSVPGIMALRSFAICILIILAVAVFTLVERKILGSIQLRVGPNLSGPLGLLQPIADALKLLSKETVMPARSNRLLFLVSPAASFGISLACWAVIPVCGKGALVNLESGLFFLFALSSVNSFLLLLAGWASNSRYSFLGAIRTAAQLISYELSLIAALLSPAILSSSFNLQMIVKSQLNVWYGFPLLTSLLLFMILMLAETNRAPFDLPEAEAELVSGYNTEYASAAFALFFLAEYSNMLMLSALGVTCFLGGPGLPFFGSHLTVPPLFFGSDLSVDVGPLIFSLKMGFFIFLYIWARGTLPRYRYDQLMAIGWKSLLPLSLLSLVHSLALSRLSRCPPQLISGEFFPAFTPDPFFDLISSFGC